ncbi:MAG: hypothetical protein PVJ27_01735, partial [Candidatus Brocadiaceae bacterium]
FGGGKAGRLGEKRTFAATSTIGGTDTDITIMHTAGQAGERQVALRYDLRSPETAELTQIVLSIAPDKGAFRGGKCVAALADGGTNEVSLPFGRGNIGQRVSGLVLVDGEGTETRLDMEPARQVSMDGDGRIRLVGNTIRGGETVRTDVTMTLPDRASFYASREETLQRHDTSNWFPYPVGPQGVPVDLSFLNKDENGEYIPAGSHGFVTAEDGRFVFEDGTPVRFWGLNVTAGAALGSPERAEQLAERLARLGVNVVRLHHLDSWANPIIDYDHPDGTTQHLDPESVRALDKTIYELKMHGIYVIPDPWVQRCFKEADGVKDYGSLGKRGNFNLHPYIYFDERMQELIRRQWEQVWTHVNEFTGVAYKDEPAIVMTEVINEGLLIGLDGVTQDYYRRELLDVYREWAEENDGLPPGEADLFRVNYSQNNLRFFTYLHRKFYGESHDFLRSIGVRIPINATNWAHWTWVMLTQTGLDFMDCHHYYGGNQIGPGHGLGGLWLNHPPGLPGTPFGKIAGFAVPGKPVASSECGNNPPKTYRAAYQVGLAAVASLQDWDSFTGYAYSQSGRPRDTLSAFEWESDPASIASVAAGALIFRRRDVRPAEKTVVLRIPEEYSWTLHWKNGGERQYWNTPGFNCAIEEHKVLVTAPDESPEKFDPALVMTPEESFQYNHPHTELASDTGELWRDWQLGVGTIDTPRTQVAYGNLGESGRTWSTADCAFDISTPFAVAFLSSLTEENLADSDRLLLIAVARAENTGMAFNMAGTSIVQKGRAPIIAEPVVGTVEFNTSRDNLTLYPLRVDGSRGPGVDIPVKDGRATVELEPDSATIFYAVEAE